MTSTDRWLLLPDVTITTSDPDPRSWVCVCVGGTPGGQLGSLNALHSSIDVTWTLTIQLSTDSVIVVNRGTTNPAILTPLSYLTPVSLYACVAWVATSGTMQVKPCYYVPCRGAKYCDQRVCLSVYLCICLLLYLKNHTSIFNKCSAHVTSGRGSILLWLRCDTLRTSGFVGDVMFLYNAGNRTESKTTRTFRPVRQVETPAGR